MKLNKFIFSYKFSNNITILILLKSLKKLLTNSHIGKMILEISVNSRNNT